MILKVAIMLLCPYFLFFFLFSCAIVAVVVLILTRNKANKQEIKKQVQIAPVSNYMDACPVQHFVYFLLAESILFSLFFLFFFFCCCFCCYYVSYVVKLIILSFVIENEFIFTLFLSMIQVCIYCCWLLAVAKMKIVTVTILFL